MSSCTSRSRRSAPTNSRCASTTSTGSTIPTRPRSTFAAGSPRFSPAACSRWSSSRACSRITGSGSCAGTTVASPTGCSRDSTPIQAAKRRARGAPHQPQLHRDDLSRRRQAQRRAGSHLTPTQNVEDAADAPSGRGALPSEGNQGDESDAYVTLGRMTGTNAGSTLGACSPRVTECP